MTNLTWYPVIRFPLEKDLKPFLNHLSQLNILYHVTEEEGQQQLWISDKPRVLEVAEQSSRWVAGEFIVREHTPRQDPPDNKVSKLLIAVHLFRLVPVSLGTILLGFLGALAVFADTHSLSYAEPFLFQAIYNGQILPVEAGFKAGHYWRLLTPAFLHFGLLHILFNSLILWEVGRRIELAKGSIHYMLVILLIGITANVAQYLSSPNTVFGGLSGIVYGVIGYIAVYQEYIKHPVLQFNKAAIAFFVVWLLLGAFGIIDWFIQGGIANAAHFSGLVAGALIGALVAWLDRLKLPPKTQE